MKRLFFIFVMLNVSLMAAHAAETCSKSSPAYTVALLELYSSEGCSSCPPADKLISKLYQTTGLNTDQVIPLALHVDYWDYIGWEDPYAKALHTERQRYLSKLASSNSIYTPEFFMGGQEFRPWRTDLRKAVESINQQPAQASIHIRLDKISANYAAVQIDTNTNEASLLNYMLVEQALTSRVKAGENSGETLQHDAVVREWGAPVSLTPNVASKNNLHITIPANSITKNLSVVAFIQNQQGKILQALSIPLCAAWISGQ